MLQPFALHSVRATTGRAWSTPFTTSSGVGRADTFNRKRYFQNDEVSMTCRSGCGPSDGSSREAKRALSTPSCERSGSSSWRIWRRIPWAVFRERKR